MSSETSSTVNKIDTRVSSPGPDFHDHRRRPGRATPHSVRSPQPMSPVIAPGVKMNIPVLEVRAATPPLAGISSNAELLQVDDALRQIETTPVTRDFEHAIDDGSADDNGDPGPRRRRETRRGGRSRDIEWADGRSRDLEWADGRPRDIEWGDRSRSSSSSSRSTSPANSIEAFAEPRRRLRANTIDSQPSIGDFRARQHSFDACCTRRPTLSSVPPILSRVTPHVSRMTNEAIPDDATDHCCDSDAGKTYKIDFEELDEFVALCNQGLIPGESNTSSEGSSQQTEPKIFCDLRTDDKLNNVNNVALNPDTFFEKAVGAQQHSAIQSSKPQPQDNLIRHHTKVHAPEPDRFTFFSSEIQHSKHAPRIGELLKGDDTFRDLFDVGPEGGVWWLDVVNPTKAELEAIAKAFKIHRLTREDIETQESREKVELFSQYYFVSFRSFNPDKSSEDFLDPLHIYIVVTQDGVLSFSYMANPHAKNVRRRIAKLGDFLSLGPDYICYAMIDDIVDSFAPIIHEAEVESENIEDLVFIAREEDFLALLRQIGECRKKVLNMMRLLGGKADVIKGFAKRCNEQYQITPRGDIGLYLGDIQDHVITMMSNLTHVEKMLSRSHANYLAQINVDGILKGNHTNKALAKITVIASIVVPLNIVTGLFGMNVHVPGQNIETFWWFGGILIFMAAFVVVMIIAAKRLRFI